MDAFMQILRFIWSLPLAYPADAGFVSWSAADSMIQSRGEGMVIFHNACTWLPLRAEK